MKKIITIFTLSILLFPQIINAWKDTSFSKENWYKLYLENIDKWCESYKDGKKIIFQTKQYLKVEEIDSLNTYTKNFDLNYAKKTYRENMNTIYKCALIWVKNDAYSKVIEFIKPEKELLQKIKEEKNKLNLQEKSLKCKNISWNKWFDIKKIILDQTTYEICSYNFYLEYLKTYNDDLWKLVKYDQIMQQAEKNGNQTWLSQSIVDNYDGTYGSTWINQVIKIQNQKKMLINKEIEKAYEIFPVVYAAYTDYENAITTHLLLEVIKYDYFTFKNSLHKTLGPINQVIYKISNAMKL